MIDFFNQVSKTAWCVLLVPCIHHSDLAKRCMNALKAGAAGVVVHTAPGLGGLPTKTP